ncbi:spermidine/putrescine ABC transporter ATP-binding protein [Mycobacterium sp. NS-7484]|uniref:ABC transporter ATP-binding protein n=1 Tax=unclassified Mycobacterium TaxID=2642494 RepID=UPI0007FDC7EE|nr:MULTISPECIES: ABC transporter ATP-binding protein [unclassified Mycobacterium]OBG80828.1 spermidine/putrescine ABC transporter ATP-binding protein [Mycobacterium sp. E802]OMB97366.1 spermidine/putrescine ABC transporter ATP-binding protein [Mycobacterium sp. NS-7484]
MNSSVGVELRKLTRTYGNVNALDGLSLSIGPGELVALLGPSGCGKTTAMRILAGLDEATSGAVLVGGRDISSVPANKRDMGMVFQAYSLFPHLTVLDNVAFGLKMRGKSKRHRLSRAGDMLDLVGLTAHRNKYASELSGGQQQRVALARALAIEPRVLLLDEPLSALDAQVRTQLRDEIRRVQLEVGTTTLFVTHDQEEALAVADRVGVMSHGKLEQLATPTELYARPATPFVAEFVGLHNKVPARVSGRRARLLGTEVPTLRGSVTAGAGTAMVRPESIRLRADPSGRAVVASVAFLGSISRVYLTLPDGTVIHAQLPSSQARFFEPGAPVSVALEPLPVLVI